MAEKTLAQKMLVKPGQQIALVNAPADYEARLGALPDGATTTREPAGTYDAVHAFFYHKADVDAMVVQAIALVKPGGLVWLAYPKKSGSIRTDITRDHGWDALAALDWHGVAQISLDDTWSLLRVRPRAEIKKFTRRF